MRKNLLYLIVLFCVSLVATQRIDIEDSSFVDQSKITHEDIREFQYSITESTHEQSATRPTNVQVPSISRTHSAHRSGNSVYSPTGFALKSDLNSHDYSGALKYLNSNILTAGFIDSSSYFKSLCRLLI